MTTRSTSSRRQILIGGVASFGSSHAVTGIAANAAIVPVDPTTNTLLKDDNMNINNNNNKNDNSGPGSVDMTKINAARQTNPASPTTIGRGSMDPPPTLGIRGRTMGGTSTTISIPRVGYSFYKTPPDQAERCTKLALRAGIQHFDMATSYESNPRIAKALKQYLDRGITGLDYTEEKLELLQYLDTTKHAGDVHAQQTMMGGGSMLSTTSILAPPPMGSAGRRGRRESLFLSHKLANEGQSTDATTVRRAVKATIATLGCSYLDMVSIHSPLTDQDRRLTTYRALLDLRDSGFIKTVGVCNYGLGPLQEIMAAGLDLPAVNQLEISPFNTHQNVVEWCQTNGVAMACSAWSKLSSVDGPTEGWDKLSKLAQTKRMTKAQLLVRWSLQKGYICVPRSGCASKVERMAIAENSYGGVNTNNNDNNDGSSENDPPSFRLTTDEMMFLDSLDIEYKAGRLGRRDGWSDADVTGPNWDPTDYVV